MDIENINDVTDKLLNKLAEDYNLCENQQKSAKRIMAEVKQQQAWEKLKLVRSLPDIDERTVKACEMAHANAVADTHKAIAYDAIKDIQAKNEDFDMDLAKELDDDLSLCEANESLKEAPEYVTQVSDANQPNATEKTHTKDDKVLKKIAKLTSKLGELQNKLSNCKLKISSVIIKRKIRDVKERIDALEKKHSAVNDILKNYSPELHEDCGTLIQNSVELDALDEELDVLLAEADELEASCETAKKEADSEFDSIFEDDIGRRLKSLLVNFDSIDDPYTKKIVSLIRRELMKPEIDMTKIRELKLKLKLN